ncbi:hypothetical protein HSACCH_02592 [Halanaerobium saccharolyticum subsp. saccharolyticum DSM 6643]|uniref:N-acetyltransferase domain-containing protein n=1 Tax=Halanaerobium saccharolyticum subsp. saccharolyticum DSM 6643 TaxID=1293054 RepID=M5E4X5_9FIRM|nr:GNAT family N-acetyltransferase [Halanaerobium saccharolyticum]CCU81110.1 hypothetical protein HSACCH_02592 [Halanaerobium saccharolyticum subsp. saccharolyticum DSM 6643]
MLKNKIINQLNKNRAKNISMIGIIENYGLESNLEFGDSLLITVRTDQLWCYISSNSRNELIELLKKFENRTAYFASIESWMIPAISQNRKIEWELKTERLILPEKLKLAKKVELISSAKKDTENKKTEIKEKDTENIEEIKIRKLKADDADFIFDHSHYQKFTSKPYIRERIDADCSAGIFIKGELAAWGLTHDDGAVGFIHVRKAFRKRGFARLIIKKLIEDKRKNNNDVFLNVEQNNLKAKKLFYSLGFEFDRVISWIKIKK